MPHLKVQERLRISYEALDYKEKQIFLDTACFFVGSSIQSPNYMWESCCFFPEVGIERLSDMSLIKVDKDGKLMMHDQMRDLGRTIVLAENPRNPQERSRLWIHEEAEHVLSNNGVRFFSLFLLLGECEFVFSFLFEIKIIVNTESPKLAAFTSKTALLISCSYCLILLLEQ